MKRMISWGWLGGLLAGAALIAGCRHFDEDCGCGGPVTVTPIAGMPSSSPTAVIVATPTVSPSITPAKVSQAKDKEVPPSQPIVQASVKEEPVKRRSFADITADPYFGHAPDYSWLRGELQFMADDHTWRIRYASVDEDDQYGGSMTLVDCGPMTNYSSGQKVRVAGHPNDSDSKDASTTYKVTSISPLK